jgi:putative DNA methylase
VEWFKGHEFKPGDFGEAETLSKGTDTGIDVLRKAGMLTARGGKVTLLSVLDISEDYDLGLDERVSEWKICLHLAKRLRESGAHAGAQLMAKARDKVDLDDVKELAYLLYSIAEKKGWAETALLFNALGTSWSDLEDASRKITGPAQVQGLLGE